MLAEGSVLAAAGQFGVVPVYSADFLGIVAHSGKDFMEFLLAEFFGIEGHRYLTGFFVPVGKFYPGSVD